MRGDNENRFRERWEEKKERWENYRGSQGNSHIWTGLFILLIGVAALLRNTNPELPHWLFSWRMFLVALGVFIGFKHNFRGVAWLILIIVGGVLLLPEFYPELEARRYMWPVILIAVGMMIIFRPRHKFRACMDQKKKPATSEPGITIPEETYSSEKDYQEDFVDSTSIFGGAKKNIISKNFKGGDLVNIFGGTELDLSRADFKGTAIIELTTICGGTKLIVPSNWSVRSEAVTIFGGLEDKRNTQSITGSEEKVLLLKGTVIFGGIEIKSFN